MPLHEILFLLFWNGYNVALIVPLHDILLLLFFIGCNVALFATIVWCELNPLYVLEDGDL